MARLHVLLRYPSNASSGPTTTRAVFSISSADIEDQHVWGAGDTPAPIVEKENSVPVGEDGFVTR